MDLFIDYLETHSKVKKQRMCAALYVKRKCYAEQDRQS